MKTCMWCKRVPVASLGDVCPDCLDRRMRQLNLAIRVNSGRGWGRGEDEVRAVQPLVTERRVLMRRMSAERQRYWKAVLKHGMPKLASHVNVAAETACD